MNRILDLIAAHQIAFAFASAFFFCAFVDSLAKPGAFKSSGGCYGQMYRFLQACLPLAQAVEARRAALFMPPQPPPAPPGTVQVIETQTVTATPKV